MNFQPHASIALALLALTAPFANAAVQRSSSEEAYSPLIVLSVTPPALTTAYAVEESLSDTALPTQINENGSYDAATGKIKWGPFFDDQSRTLSYRLSGPAGAVALSGKASYNGSPEPFANSSVTLPDPNTSFYGYQYQKLSTRDFTQFPLGTDIDTDNDGISEFTRYAFGIDYGNLVIETDPPAPGPQTATLRAYISNQSADTSYTLEASTDLSDWEPIATRLPGLTLTSRTPSSVSGTDELLYSAVPLDKDSPLIIRLRAIWLAAPID